MLLCGQIPTTPLTGEARLNTYEQTPLAHRVDSACHRLGVGRTKLYSLISEKKLKAIKIGTRTLIPESELQRLIANQLEEA